MPLQPFEQRHQRDRDDQRGSDRQEEARARLQGEGKRQHQPHAGDQHQCRHQPVAAQARRRLLAFPMLRHVCGRDVFRNTSRCTAVSTHHTRTLVHAKIPFWYSVEARLCRGNAGP